MVRPSVLIGFAESLAAIESAWDLLDHGYCVSAFARAGSRAPLGKDPRVRLHEVTAPEKDAAACVQEIVALAELLDDPVLLPLDDASIWILDEVSQIRASAVVAGPTGQRARLSLDKTVQLSEAAAAGLNVPPTRVVDRGVFDDRLAGDFPREPPWIVKPALAIELRDGVLIKGKADLVTKGNELEPVLATRTDVVLVQPVLSGGGEGLFGQASPGGVRNWSAHRRVRMMNPLGSGSSACRSVEPDDALLSSAGRFIERTQWEGLFMLEFLRDEAGTAWFMELNGRTWGSLVLARRRGLAYPSWTVAAALDPGQIAGEIDPGPHLTARHLGREVLHLAFVARGRSRRRRGAVAAPPRSAYPPLGRTLRDVLSWRRTDGAYNARRGGGRVLLADTTRTVLDGIRPSRTP